MDKLCNLSALFSLITYKLMTLSNFKECIVGILKIGGSPIPVLWGWRRGSRVFVDVLCRMRSSAWSQPAETDGIIRIHRHGGRGWVAQLLGKDPRNCSDYLPVW